MDVKSVILLHVPLHLLLVVLLPASLTLCEETDLDEANIYGDSRGDVLLDAGSNKIEQPSRPMLRPAQTSASYWLPHREDNYLYFPKQRHLKAARLHKMLGSSFDPSRMSVERPSDADGDRDPAAAQRSSEQVVSRKLHGAVSELNFTVLEDSGIVVTATEATRAFMTRWLLQTATCGMTSSWHDLGSVFWPRWVRQSHCDDGGVGGGGGCSWPAGMSCMPAQSTHIKILAWHCHSLRSASNNLQPMQQCTWMLVPFPLVTACRCGCG